MYKPNAQIYADLIISIIALILALMRNGFIPLKSHPKLKREFDNFFPMVSPNILYLYALKPIVIWTYAKCKKMTNHSYFANTLFVNRIVYDIFLIFFPSIGIMFTPKYHCNVKELIMFIAPALILEIIIYHISLKEAIQKAERINFRMIKTKINTKEQNNEMFSTDDEDVSVKED